MDLSSGFLSGWKTYIVAALTIISAWALYATGVNTLDAAIQLTITAILAATVRHGITTESAKPVVIVNGTAATAASAQ